MKKSMLKILIVVLLSMSFLLPGVTNLAQAQTQNPTPTQVNTSIVTSEDSTATPVVTPTATPASIAFANPNVVTFSQLQNNQTGNTILTGPFDGVGIGFVLPADWVLTEGTELDLQYAVSFNTAVQGDTDIIIASGGTLSVLLNDELLQAIPLNKVGESETRISIPISAFSGNDNNGFHTLRFILESYESCRFFGQNTTVYIHPNSYLTLPHNFVKPSTSLLNFPRPLYQDSFTPDSAYIIFPDDPSAAELQAVLTTVAGMGRLTDNELILELATIGKMSSIDVQNNHLIFIGKGASLPLQDLDIPLQLTNGKFQQGDNVGVVEMVDSPWSKGHHVALVISSDTDQGLIKAAQAISTGILRPNRTENLAIIDQVNLVPAPTIQPVDRTLTDLGYEGRVFRDRGYDDQTYIFNIPPGNVVTDAYFELVYGHSALLDYANSQIIVFVNDLPIGSVRMNDETAGIPTNRIKFTIPSTAVRPGVNKLDIAVNMMPLDECSQENLQGLWVNIWPESLLHLPQVAMSIDPLTPQDLSLYPSTLIQNSTLLTTAFVLERNDLQSWQNAAKLAALLGQQSTGPIFALSAFYGDDVPLTTRPNFNYLVVGRPSQLPFALELNDQLPAPFDLGNDVANEKDSFQVTYKIPVDSPMGYIEIMKSPWNASNIVVAVLGNTSQGVTWAANALVDPTLNWRLGGNFAVVNNTQILTTNSNAIVAATSESADNVSPVSPIGPVDENSANPSVNERGWILPAIVVLMVALVLVLGAVVVGNLKNNRVRNKNS